MQNTDISAILDIFIITYNRASKLDCTLRQILSEKSPIKDFEITILDNNSTDNTKAIVEKYSALNKNIRYQKNKYNIGGNANIVKAFYKANKEYVWILADNDNYCFEAWEDVERHMKEKSDAIIVATYECPKYDIAQLFLQTSFLPGVIYRTSNIDDTVMGNMEFNISNMFPHLALSAKLINENKKIAILDKAIVLIGDNRDEKGEYIYTRGYDGSFVHPLLKGMNWICGYANSLYMIKDKKIRNYIISHNRFCTELNSSKLFFFNPKDSEKNLYNYLCVFAVLDFKNKIKFLINLILFFTLYRIIYISRRISFDDQKQTKTIQIDLRLFSCIKTKLFRITQKLKGAY